MTGGAGKMHGLMSVMQRLVSRIPDVFASAVMPGAPFGSEMSTVTLVYIRKHYARETAVI